MASILGAGIGEVYRCPCDGRQLGLGKMRSWFLPTGFPKRIVGEWHVKMPQALDPLHRHYMNR